MKLVDQSPFPVLVEISQIDLDSLRGELGQSVEEVIEALNSMVSNIDDEFFEIVSQQSNFQLTKSLEPGRASLYHIILTADDPIFPKFCLEQIAY